MNKVFSRLYEMGGVELAARMLKLHEQRCGKALDRLQQGLRRCESHTVETYLDYLCVYCEEVGVEEPLSGLREVRQLARQKAFCSAGERLQLVRGEIEQHHRSLSEQLRDWPEQAQVR